MRTARSSEVAKFMLQQKFYTEKEILNHSVILLLLFVMMVVVPNVNSLAFALLIEPLNLGFEFVLVSFFVPLD